MVCNGDGLGSGLHVCVRAFSKPRQRGSQEPYQSTRPPCEMSSRSRRLWDCCRHPNSLWMSASLTGQLAYTALLTTQPHFQLLFFNSPPPPFFTRAQRLSMAKKMTDTGTILKRVHSTLAEETRRICSLTRWGEHRAKLTRDSFLFAATQTGLVEHAAQYAAEYPYSWT